MGVQVGAGNLMKWQADMLAEVSVARLRGGPLNRSALSTQPTTTAIWFGLAASRNSGSGFPGFEQHAGNPHKAAAAPTALPPDRVSWRHRGAVVVAAG